MTPGVWCVMPVLSGPELTEAAIADLLAQTVLTRILVINQGVEDSFRQRLERISEQEPDRVLVWSHVPPLPSLAATWNRGLQFCWQVGATEALVVNNDVRLDQRTVSILQTVLTWPKEKAFLVSGVGVTAEQFDARPDPLFDVNDLLTPEMPLPKGGPDFSCFLISRAGHEKYPFDEGFVPAYGEDCDLHRRYLLGGDGDRIFSINLPYHHVGGGSGTLKTLAPEARAALERRLGQSREYYARKWGGGVNQETYTIPFEPESKQPGVTNPELQRLCLDASPEA